MLKLLTLDAQAQALFGLVSSNLAELRYSLYGAQQVMIDQYWACLLLASTLCCLAVLVRFSPWKWTRVLPKGLADQPAEIALCCYIPAVVTLATVTTYYVGNGGANRIFSVYLLVILMIAAAARRPALRMLFLAAMVYNIAMADPCLWMIRTALTSSFSGAQRVAAFREAVRQDIIFTPNANAWENTLLSDRIPPDLVGLTPGIGLSWMMTPAMLAHAKSRYIIATPSEVAKAGIKVRALQKLNGVDDELPPSAKKEKPYLFLNLSRTH
jgi:hypothetical protein